MGAVLWPALLLYRIRVGWKHLPIIALSSMQFSTLIDVIYQARRQEFWGECLILGHSTKRGYGVSPREQFWKTHMKFGVSYCIYLAYKSLFSYFVFFHFPLFSLFFFFSFFSCWEHVRCRCAYCFVYWSSDVVFDPNAGAITAYGQSAKDIDPYFKYRLWSTLVTGKPVLILLNRPSKLGERAHDKN